MKTYPKVPPYSHPKTDTTIFAADDLSIIEKFDGGNARIQLYEERFEDEYADDVQALNPNDGALVFGTKTKVRGTHRTPVEEVDAVFKPFLSYLRSHVDREAIRGLHDTHGPLIFFTEHMARHSIDYQSHSESEIPPLLGFDVFAVREGPTEVRYGYDETFEGFLDIDTAWSAFEAANIPTATIISHPGERVFLPHEFEVPQSSIASLKAEGVILRSDRKQLRVKFRSEEFIEKNQQVFGLRPEQCETGAEYLVAKYCTHARIRKILHKLVVDEGNDFGLHLNDELHRRVVDDIWEEHHHEIQRLDMLLNPSNVPPLVAEKCIEYLRLLQDNAELTDSDPLDIWAEMTN